MINHSNCDHPSTSSARARCRRQANGGTTKATPKELDFTGSGGAKAQTPGRRDLECDNCGVERIAYRGTDPLTGVLRFVGERCYYTVKRSPDTIPLD